MRLFKLSQNNYFVVLQGFSCNIGGQIASGGLSLPYTASHGLGHGQNEVKGQTALETRVTGSRGAFVRVVKGSNGRFNNGSKILTDSCGRDYSMYGSDHPLLRVTVQ